MPHPSKIRLRPLVRDSRWLALVAAATGLMALAVATRGLHTDDVAIFAELGTSYREAWSQPFFGRFYRPLVVTLCMLSRDIFGEGAAPLRIVHAALIVISVSVFWRASPAIAARARAGGVLVLLGSPFGIVSIAPFTVGIADTIVGLCLLVILIRTFLGDKRPGFAELVLVVCALASKETGLIVAAAAALASLRGRRWGLAACSIAIALGYVVFRQTVIEAQPVVFRSGVLFDMYSPAELKSHFGHRLWVLYLHNVAANLTTILIYIPFQGQLAFGGAIIPFAAVTTLTTLVVGRFILVTDEARRFLPIVGLVIANAILGYAYVRTRIMFPSSWIVALLFAQALATSDRRLAHGALLVWVAVLASSVYRVFQM